jgi:3,4-dihydroxy 2-butanone 4-phosphate synthase/GTP cyclohydrolase II
MPFSPIPDAIEDFRAGRMLVVVDDEDRENEGTSPSPPRR